MREVPCPSCHGARLKPVSLAVTVDGRSIAEYCALPIGELAKRLLELELSDTDRQIAPGSSRRSAPGWASCWTSGWIT